MIKGVLPPLGRRRKRRRVNCRSAAEIHADALTLLAAAETS